jgi:pimeloyl-ACP methyl ester carboxylesterase
VRPSQLTRPELSYTKAGSGPPIVLLHGLTFDRSTWDPWGCPGLTDWLIMPPPGGGVVGSAVRIRRV